MMQHNNPTQHIYAYSMYLLSTAYPLVMTNASSDNGQYRGSNPRVSVFAKLGESAFPSIKFQSSIAQGFSLQRSCWRYRWTRSGTFMITKARSSARCC